MAGISASRSGRRLVAIAATLLGAAAFGLLSSGGDYRLAITGAAVFAALGALVMLAGNLIRLRRPLPSSPA